MKTSFINTENFENNYENISHIIAICPYCKSENVFIVFEFDIRQLIKKITYNRACIGRDKNEGCGKKFRIAAKNPLCLLLYS